MNLAQWQENFASGNADTLDINYENRNLSNYWTDNAKRIGSMIQSGNEVKGDLDALLNGLRSNSGFTRAKTIAKIIAMIFGGGD